MRLLVIAIILVACTLAFVAGLNARTPENPLLIDAAFPQVDRIVIPWTLNTQCTINSGNLIVREPERNA